MSFAFFIDLRRKNDIFSAKDAVINFKLFIHTKQQLAFKKLAKEMEILFEIKNEDEIIAGYTKNDQAISVSEYIKNIQNRIDDVKDGKVKTYTCEEVLKSLLKTN